MNYRPLSSRVIKFYVLHCILSIISTYKMNEAFMKRQRDKNLFIWNWSWNSMHLYFFSTFNLIYKFINLYWKIPSQLFHMFFASNSWKIKFSIFNISDCKVNKWKPQKKTKTLSWELLKFVILLMKVPHCNLIFR